MAIREPILAFTLSRADTKPAHDPGPAPPRDDQWDRRLQVGMAANEIARVAALGEGLPETDFDYAAVPTENVAEINKLVSRIKATHKRHLEAVFEIGADLLRAKELLGHGNFLPWLQAEFRWSERTANIYMKIAQRFQGKTAIFADLDIGTAYAIANAPLEVRNDIFERAKAGESISREEIKEKIAKRSSRAMETLSNATPEVVKAIDEGRISVSLAAKLRYMSPKYQSMVIAAKRPTQAFKIIDGYLGLIIPNRPSLPEDPAESLKIAVGALRKEAERWARKSIALAEPAAEPEDEPALAEAEAPPEPIEQVADDLHRASIDRRAKFIWRAMLGISSVVLTEGWSSVADALADLMRDSKNEQYLSDIREAVDHIKQAFDTADNHQKKPDLRLV